MNKYMAKRPLVSVVITAYNYADFIEQSVSSVLDQTYDAIEIIVINDGSTDNTRQILEKYKDQITIIDRENKGIVYTRNEGMGRAKGVYVMQLDADDYLDKEYVRKAVTIAEEDKVDIVYTQVRIFGRAEFVSQYIEYDLEKLKHDNYIHATSLIRRAILGENPYDGYLDGLGYEDWDLFLGLCLDGAKAKLLNEPLLHYRKHINRKSRSDEFVDTYKEMLVRHHIWSKQNNKHPDEFWYFSSQITLLLSMINLYTLGQQTVQENAELKKANEYQKNKIKRLEKRDPIVLTKKIIRKVRGHK